LVVRESESRRQLESLVSEKAESDILVNTLQNRVASLDEEVGKLRRQVHELQQESAAKEVTVTQLNKWREQDKEDIKGLNIALDSKQQELELLKRKMGVRGTAGSTPAPASHKRESSIFNTPTVIRPPSALSDSSKDGGGKKRTIETPSTIKTLAKSVRVNGSTMSTVTKAVNRLEGSMGAPPLSAGRKVSGPVGTPFRQPTIHSRSTSTSLSSSTSMPKPAAHQRRVSNLDPVTPVRPKTSLASNGSRSGGSSPTLSEKENNRSLVSVKTAVQKESTTKRTVVPT
ncbi:hypothetical protein BDM02DRAFT_3094244, partial [Thelephora ganbajun]